MWILSSGFLTGHSLLEYSSRIRLLGYKQERTGIRTSNFLHETEFTHASLGLYKEMVWNKDSDFFLKLFVWDIARRLYEIIAKVK